MRNRIIYQLFILFVFSGRLFSQIFSEDFTDQPSGLGECPNDNMGNPWDCAGCPSGGENQSPWFVDSVGDSCTAPPCMVFHYSPTCDGEFVLNMGPPPLPVEANAAVRVSYRLHLQTWSSGGFTATNGMRVLATANPEDGPDAVWDTTFTAELSPEAGLPTFDGDRSFVINTPGPQLKVVWQAYGDNNWEIDYWIVDNIIVEELSAPEFVLASSSVQANNEFVLIAFDQGVYANPDGTGGLIISDFVASLANNINEITF